MAWRSAALLCGAFFLLSQAALAQRPPSDSRSSPAPRTYPVRGFLRLAATERGVDQTQVTLRRFTGEEVMTAFTRSNGEFDLGGVPAGSYVLVVEESGYEPIRESLEVAGSRVGIVLHLRLAGSGPVEGGRIISARELALPGGARDAFRKGMDRLYGRRDLAGSIPHFEKTLALKPDFYEAHHQLGVAQLEMGRFTEAEASLGKSIALSVGKYAPAQFALAGLLCNADRFADAAAAARSGLHSDPAAWEGYFELARALLGLGRNDEAEHAALRARSRNADFAPLYLILANIHMRRKDTLALIGDLDEYLRLEPEGSLSQSAREMRANLQRAQAPALRTPTAAAVPPKP